MTRSQQQRADEQAARLRKQEAQIQLVTALASLLALAWCLIPPHQRKLWAMTAADRAKRILSRAARRTGHQAMAAELASGRADAYVLPYLLSVARDKAAATYEQLRGVTG